MSKVLKTLIGIALLLLGILLAERAVMLSWIHGFIGDHLGDMMGGDPTIKWLVAFAALALIRIVPLRPLLVAPLTGGTKSLLAFATVCLATAGGLKMLNSRLPFDPKGNPKQSFIETASGPVVLDEPPGGTDMKTGLVRQALTRDVLRAINLEKERRKNGPRMDPNRYFSSGDGGPKAWFAPGTCEIRDSPGFDDRGRKLQPATAEIVDRCEQLRAEAERRRKQEIDAQAKRDLLQQHKLRRLQFQEIGRYVATGHHITIDGVRFVFQECVVLRHQTQIKFRVINPARDGQSGYRNPSARFEFSLLINDGTVTSSSAIRRVEGMVVTAPDNGTLMAPSPGESISVVVDFQRDSESGGFAIGLNNAVAFNKPAGHIARFRGF